VREEGGVARTRVLDRADVLAVGLHVGEAVEQVLARDAHVGELHPPVVHSVEALSRAIKEKRK